MFNTTSQLKIHLDLSHFDTKNIENFGYMFYNSGITSVDLSSFETSNGTSFSSMFYGCSKLTELNVNHFDTSNATGMNQTFYSMSLIKDLDISNWDASKVDACAYFISGTNLENLVFLKNLGKGFTKKSNNSNTYKLDFSGTRKLTHDSLMDVINKLYDLNLTYNVANGGKLYTQQLILGTTNMEKLTSEEIAIATAKGWTVS
jgi:surface protein